MRLDVNDPNVFDKWRELYDDLTTEEQKEFYNKLELKYPYQQSFTQENYYNFFKRYHNLNVLEFGGWKGELSEILMQTCKIKSWTNIELCQNAIDKTVNKRENYNVINPDNFKWFESPLENKEKYDVFIASHVIEHINDSELWKLLDNVNGIEFVLLEAPINKHINNWNGYLGTHILKAGWNVINAYMLKLSYSFAQVDLNTYHYAKIKK